MTATTTTTTTTTTIAIPNGYNTHKEQNKRSGEITITIGKNVIYAYTFIDELAMHVWP